MYKDSINSLHGSNLSDMFNQLYIDVPKKKKGATEAFYRKFLIETCENRLECDLDSIDEDELDDIMKEYAIIKLQTTNKKKLLKHIKLAIQTAQRFTSKTKKQKKAKPDSDSEYEPDSESDTESESSDEQSINERVLLMIENEKLKKEQLIIDKLKIICPKEKDDKLLELYKLSISIHQSKMQGNGSFFENEIITTLLDENDISYRQQVTIDSTGTIIGFNVKKKCHHILDFVIGSNIKIGNSITNYKVLSCKTTCRERWTQDNWSLTIKPRKYLLLTLSNDYPSRERFNEGRVRKMISCISKTRDDRKYKLTFDDLIEEIL
jgi:hypothetical protein